MAERTTDTDYVADHELISEDGRTPSGNIRRLPRVEKDTDDPSHPPDSSPQTRTTFTTLTRLLGASSSLSPEASRASSYINPVQQHGYIRHLNVTETAALPDHLFTRGLCQGRHSDITVWAFNTQYKLHRIILDRSPFFATALSGPWMEAKSSEIVVRPEEIDANITQHGFELALKRLYRGTADVEEEDRYPIDLFTTGCWLELPDLIEASLESILRQMCPDTLGATITLVTKNYYGRAGEKILASSKAMLCRNGWRMSVRHWDTIPADIVHEIISSDGLYVDGEWERWLLAKRVIDRRLRAKAVESGLLNISGKRVSMSENIRASRAIRPGSAFGVPSHLAEYAAVYADKELAPLLALLDEGIHYIHLDFEQLQYVRSAKDVFGLPALPEKVISNALWQQMELRQRVLNSHETDLELGLAVELPQDDAEEAGKATNADHNNHQPEEAEPDSQTHATQARKYWIPTTDCNLVMGGNSDPVISISQNPATVQADSSRWQNTTMDRIERLAAVSIDVQGPPSCYSNLPPFRFSAEFPPPRLLKEKKRVYSRTVFYAGSLWNIYIQKVTSSRSTKKLGVYLHRVKEKDTEEGIFAAASTSIGHASVGGRIGVLERELLQHRRHQPHNLTHWDDDESSADASSPRNSQHFATAGAPTAAINVQGLRRASRVVNRNSAAGDVLTASSDLDNGSESDTDPDLRASATPTAKRDLLIPTLPPYVDLRPTVKTYFKIYSPSRGGRMLSVYESAPDQFSFSESWGWKSSTLMLDEGLLSPSENEQLAEGIASRDTAVEDSADGVSNLTLTASKEEGSGKKTVKSMGDGKLRFMVVIGIL